MCKGLHEPGGEYLSLVDRVRAYLNGLKLSLKFKV
uniref:Uncharacterized protein n=1 Tax=Setaria italica TaxID=4555 RepID=K4A3S6_SETIT